MKCNNCGETNHDEDAIFCVSCGARLIEQNRECNSSHTVLYGYINSVIRKIENDYADVATLTSDVEGIPFNMKEWVQIAGMLFYDPEASTNKGDDICVHVCINSPHVSDKVSIYEKFGFGNDDNPQDDCVAKWYKWDERNSIAKDVEELVIALAGESKANSFISDDAYNEISSRKLEQMREEEKRKKRRYSWIGYGIGFAISIIPILILCIRENKKQKDFEQYKRQIMQEERVITNANGYEYVDLGLSVKWATCNVGATSPEDYGNYYAWGETMTKSNYDNSVTNGKKMSKISGKTQYDAARANWGGTWRLPTDAELEELKNKCTWTLTIQNGIKGYNITGINGNSIFLPAAGYRSESSLNGDGDFGHYWSSTPTFNYEHYAYALTFYDREKRVYWEGNNRGKGYSIRPVTN